jgi:hypothetical protein
MCDFLGANFVSIKAQVLLQELQVLNKMQAIVDVHIAIVVKEIDWYKIFEVSNALLPPSFLV